MQASLQQPTALDTHPPPSPCPQARPWRLKRMAVDAGEEEAAAPAAEGRGRGRGATTAEQEEADMERFLQAGLDCWFEPGCHRLTDVLLSRGRRTWSASCRQSFWGCLLVCVRCHPWLMDVPLGRRRGTWSVSCRQAKLAFNWYSNPLQELEEDPEMRARVALYKDPNFDPAAAAAAVQGGMGESGALLGGALLGRCWVGLPESKQGPHRCSSQLYCDLDLQRARFLAPALP